MGCRMSISYVTFSTWGNMGAYSEEQGERFTRMWWTLNDRTTEIWWEIIFGEIYKRIRKTFIFKLFLLVWYLNAIVYNKY